VVPFSINASMELCMNPQNLKTEAHRMVDQLTEDATWDDLMREIYVRQAIESGLRDSDQGRLTSVEQVREKFGLPS
jgi:predicted transcriptional regulator